jgi:tetratricopeptide (TPR) repeat protein
MAVTSRAAELSLVELRRRVDANPSDVAALVALGRAYLQKGMAAEAITTWESLARSDAGSASVRYGLGLAYLAADRFEDALSSMTEAIRLEPNRSEFYQAAARCASSLYRYPEALAYLDSAEKITPNGAVIAFQRAKIQSQLGHLDVAVGLFEKAKVLGYDAVECDFERGHLLFRTGDRAGALAALDAALRANPSHLGARYIRSQVRRRLGDAAGAEADLKIHETLKRQQTDVDSIRASILRTADPVTRAQLWTSLGRAHLAYGNAVAAADAYQAAMALDSSLAMAHVGYAASVAALGDYATAGTAAKAALALDANLVEATALLGEIAFRQGHHDEAVFLLSDALRRKPELTTARRTYADALLSQGKREAVAEFAKALERNGDDAAAHDGLARALARLGGSLDDAATHARRATELAPTNPSFQNTLALVAFRLQRYDEAEAALNRALELRPDSANYRAGLDAVRKARAEAGR